MWFELAACSVVIVFLLEVWLFYRKKAEIIETYEIDRELNPIESAVSKRMLRAFLRLQKFELSFIYYRIRSLLMIRVIFGNLRIIESAFALVVAAGVYHFAESSAVVGAATAFYASMIFFEFQKDYAALWPQSVTASRFSPEEVMDGVSGSAEIQNLGSSEARQVQVEFRVTDPVRGCHVSVGPKETTKTTIGVRLVEDYSFILADEANTAKYTHHRAAMHGFLGINPMGAVVVRSPDMVADSRKFIRLEQSEATTEAEAEQMFDSIGDALPYLNKYSLSKSDEGSEETEEQT
ncbi:hypothetical protein [Salarchaeum japonicum]|uniref:hypothetical protein n=1 Tax=Salarchaeum japonicum TaxID=555573 RepID=UPI003C71C4FF